MAIDYKKIGWDTTKFVNPSNMNQMDNGIKEACDGVDALNVEMDAVDANLSNHHKNSLKTDGVANYDLLASVLDRLGAYYISDVANASTYHAPSVGYGFAFGQSVYRYTIIHVSLNSSDMWYRNNTMNEFKKIGIDNLLGLKLQTISLTLSTSGTTYKSISGNIDINKAFIISELASKAGENKWNDMVKYDGTISCSLSLNNSGYAQLRFDATSTAVTTPYDVRILVGIIE